MKTFHIKIHSISDIITNSSSEVFRYITSNNIIELKEFIQRILDVAESNKTVDDLFEFENTGDDLKVFSKYGKDLYYLGILPNFYTYEAEYNG